MYLLRPSWATTTEQWEEQHPDWEVMTGQPVPLGPSHAAAEGDGFAVVVRLREVDAELEGVGDDVLGALEHLDQQMHEGAD
jgi:hypothetical protein